MYSGKANYFISRREPARGQAIEQRIDRFGMRGFAAQHYAIGIRFGLHIEDPGAEIGNVIAPHISDDLLDGPGGGARAVACHRAGQPAFTLVRAPTDVGVAPSTGDAPCSRSAR